VKTLGTAAAALLLVLTTVLAGVVWNRTSETQPPRFATMPVNVEVNKPILPGNGSAAVFDEQIVAIGDFTGGSDAGGQGDSNWTHLVSAALAETRQVRFIIDTSGGGGSGYVNRGTGLPFGDQVSRLVSPATDAVIISGSRNDIVAAPGDVKAAATEIYRQIATIAPNAALIVIGPTWVDDDPPRSLLSTRDAVALAADEAGALFVDPIAEHWFTADSGLLGKDSANPTDAGHARIAALMTPVILAATNGRAQQ
jgi:lysophospholipase L1-like esterase